MEASIRNATEGVIIKDDNTHAWQYTAEYSSMDHVDTHIKEQARKLLQTLEAQNAEGLFTMRIIKPSTPTPTAYFEPMPDGWFRVLVKWPLHEFNCADEFAKYFAENVIKSDQR